MSEEIQEGGVPGASPNGRITYKDVTDMMTRLEREWREGLAKLDGKMDAFIVSHQTQHTGESQRLEDHLRTSAVMGERAQAFSHKQEGLEREVLELREWRAEVRGMTTLIKFAVGTSLVGAIVSIITLLMLIDKIATGGSTGA